MIRPSTYWCTYQFINESCALAKIKRLAWKIKIEICVKNKCFLFIRTYWLFIFVYFIRPLDIYTDIHVPVCGETLIEEYASFYLFAMYSFMSRFSNVDICLLNNCIQIYKYVSLYKQHKHALTYVWQNMEEYSSLNLWILYCKQMVPPVQSNDMPPFFLTLF